MLRFTLCVFTWVVALGTSLAAHASEIIEVDVGACWVQQLSPEMGGPGWKVASFNDDRNFVLRDGQLLSATEPALQKLFAHFPTSQYRADLYCSGGGHQLLLSLYEGATPVCVWAKRSTESNSEFVVQGIFPNPHRSAASACLGVNPGVLLVGMTDAANPTALKIYLRTRFSRLIQSIHQDPRTRILNVRLRSRENFHEAEVHDALVNDAFVSAQTRFIEYDDRILISGSELGLESGTYQGY